MNKPYECVQLQQGTEDWLNWRFEGIGASDAPAIMGENPWKSRARLMKEKRERKKPKLNTAMIRGTELEPIARDNYEKKFGISVPPACLQSNSHSWMRASVDGMTVCGSTVIEIKCGEGAYWKSAESGEVPSYYMGQLQHILAVTGLAVIDYWCYLPEHSGIHIRVPRDEIYITRLIEMEKLFWRELVESRVPVQDGGTV